VRAILPIRSSPTSPATPIASPSPDPRCPPAAACRARNVGGHAVPSNRQGRHPLPWRRRGWSPHHRSAPSARGGAGRLPTASQKPMSDSARPRPRAHAREPEPPATRHRCVRRVSKPGTASASRPGIALPRARRSNRSGHRHPMPSHHPHFRDRPRATNPHSRSPVSFNATFSRVAGSRAVVLLARRRDARKSPLHYAVARALRVARELSPLRLVALTGYGQPQDRERAREAGFDLHLVKPISPEKLLEVVAGAQ
jgi:hypothetical protein